MAKLFSIEFSVSEAELDENQHVNNVVYVQWMQDVAIAHASDVGSTAMLGQLGATWVARSHQILYLKPAFAGDRIRLTTWITSLRKARSLRKYQFLRLDDDQVLATGETEWVFIDVTTGRPRSVPQTVARCFEIVSQDPPPEMLGK